MARTVELTEAQEALIAGLIAGSEDGIDADMVTADAHVWNGLRQMFPLRIFEIARERGLVGYIEEGDDEAG